MHKPLYWIAYFCHKAGIWFVAFLKWLIRIIEKTPEVIEMATAKTKTLLTKDLEMEICKREESEGREVNITDVRRVLRHNYEILAEMDTLDALLFVLGRFKYYKSRKPVEKKRNR